MLVIILLFGKENGFLAVVLIILIEFPNQTNICSSLYIPVNDLLPKWVQKCASFINIVYTIKIRVITCVYIIIEKTHTLKPSISVIISFRTVHYKPPVPSPSTNIFIFACIC